MVARSFTASGLMPLETDSWTNLLHSRLKCVILPDEPVVIDGEDDSEDDILEVDGNICLHSDSDSESESGMDSFNHQFKTNNEYIIISNRKLNFINVRKIPGKTRCDLIKFEFFTNYHDFKSLQIILLSSSSLPPPEAMP